MTLGNLIFPGQFTDGCEPLPPSFSVPLPAHMALSFRLCLPACVRLHLSMGPLHQYVHEYLVTVCFWATVPVTLSLSLSLSLFLSVPLSPCHSETWQESDSPAESYTHCVCVCVCVCNGQLQWMAAHSMCKPIVGDLETRFAQSSAG